MVSNRLKGLVTRSSLAEKLYRVVWDSDDYTKYDSNTNLGAGANLIMNA